MWNGSGALLLCVAGSAGLLYEFRRPGSILPGAAGLALILAGCYFDSFNGPRPAGFALLTLSLALWIVEALFETGRLGAIAGIVTLAAALCFLFPGVSPALAVAASIALGWPVAARLRRAKQARINKQLDL